MKVRRKEMEGKNRGGKAPSWCALSVGHCAYIIFTFHRLQSSTSMWPAILYINKVGHVDVDDSWGLFTCADVNDAVVIVVCVVISAATSGCSKFLASTPPTHTFSSSNKPPARGWGINSRGKKENQSRLEICVNKQKTRMHCSSLFVFISFSFHSV